MNLLPVPTRVRYTWFLAKQYGFFRPLEAGWEARPELQERLGLDLSVRRRAPFLEQDLRALGLHPAALPLCRALPDLGSAPRLLGVLYVVEGSALGGQALAPRIGEALGIGRDSGGAFLHGRGPDTIPLWQAFGARLEAFGAAHPHAVGEVVAAAQGCFDHLQRWFEEAA